VILCRIKNVISVTLAPILGNRRIKLVGEGVVLEHTGGLEPGPLYVQRKLDHLGISEVCGERLTE
jgi:hypothetical protein